MLPDAFERCLKEYDAKLSLRWGTRKGCWVIDRDEHILPSERSLRHYAACTVPNPTDDALEDWRSIQLGKRRIFFTPSTDARVFDQIRLRDVQARGMEIFDSTIRAANRKKRARRAESHEKAKKAADIVHHVLTKQSSRVPHGHTDAIVAQALGLEDKTRKLHSLPPGTLLDAYGRNPAARTDVKIHTATK